MRPNPGLAACLALAAAPAYAGGQCATVEPAPLGWHSLGGTDCSLGQTVPGPQWEPTTTLRIAVVIHVIMDGSCTNGNLTDAAVRSQVDILNEDFRALAGTPGGQGQDSRIEFFLATVDPDGAPTNGITRSCDSTWYADQGQYWLTLAWDPARYLNLYTNTANGARGYVPFLPAAGGTGGADDRVVINWQAVGRNGPVPPYHQGRTATHEVGHYLGLFHVYYQGCGIATPPDCYLSGDRICDTRPDETSHHGCLTSGVSCGTVPLPVENYMELSDDLCMTGFTREQVQRMRCTLATYRPDLTPAPDAIFADGFESGDLSHWTVHSP
jgi:Pregnancy-associated plasma protein-A